MYKSFAAVAIFVSVFGFASPLSAQDGVSSEPRYVKATILSEPTVEEREVNEFSITITSYEARIDGGDAITVTQSSVFASDQVIDVSPGDRVVVAESIDTGGNVKYELLDVYRLPALGWIAAAFVLLVLVVSRLRGALSLLGLVLSGVVIMGYLVPRILTGADPLWASLSSAFLIATVTLFLAHGFTKRITIAYAGTIATLVLSGILAVVAVKFSHLFGIGSEESLFLAGDYPNLDLRGLLLGGILIGLLGVLDDVTTAQSAVVDELKRANHALGMRELYRRGLSVGREHITSLINTLFLAYAGVSMPLFLLFAANGGETWLILNNEMIAEEIIRTLVGSAGLILAVPITTLLAAYAFRNEKHPQ